MKEEPDEGLKKITDSLDILYHFRLVVEEYRGKVKASCIQKQIEPSEWKFHNSWIFKRFDVFTSRLELIKVGLLTFMKNAYISTDIDAMLSLLF